MSEILTNPHLLDLICIHIYIIELIPHAVVFSADGRKRRKGHDTSLHHNPEARTRHALHD